MKRVKLCETCGGKIVRYKHVMSRGLANALIAFAREGKRARRIGKTRLTHNQMNNFQKLRYWKLVRQVGVGSHSGVWEITRRGWEFLAEERSVPRYTRTFRAEVVAVSKQKVYVSDIPVDPFYLRYGDYVAGRREHRQVKT